MRTWLFFVGQSVVTSQYSYKSLQLVLAAIVMDICRFMYIHQKCMGNISVGNRSINCTKLHHEVRTLYHQDIIVVWKHHSIMVFGVDASLMHLMYAKTSFYDVRCFWVDFSTKGVIICLLQGDLNFDYHSTLWWTWGDVTKWVLYG